MSETSSTATPAASPAAAQPITTALRTISAPPIGTHWAEQGGIYAGMVRGAAGDYHLIVAADPAGHFEDLEFGPYGHNVAGAQSMNDGLANSQALVADAKPHLAARAVCGLNLAGHADWYLPAMGELRLIHTNTPELCDKHDWYWSSTQASLSDAWIQAFAYGYGSLSRKGDVFRAVAVRRLAI